MVHQCMTKSVVIYWSCLVDVCMPHCSGVDDGVTALKHVGATLM